jgi:hypothetical protein
MKKIILLFFIFNFLTVFGQKTPETDSSEICFPYHVGQKILLDLNDYDKVKDLLKLSENEIDTLNLIINKKDGIIKFMEQKDTTYQKIIGFKDEKFNLVSEENKNLRSDIHKLKTKNTIIEIVAGFFVMSITYLQFFTP